MKLRGKILYIYLSNHKYEVLICTDAFDSYIVKSDFKGTKIYDAPAPWGYELYYGGLFTEKTFNNFKLFEIDIYKNADYLSFQWETYTKFVKKNLYNGKNIFIMNYGCNPKPKSIHAKYNSPLRIIFLGYLGGYWVNLPLLASLNKLYPLIDIYGGPPPDKSYGLNYKGYAPTLDVMQNYQLGLITITNDPLRKNSFSSKQLDYISYGLPVLTPDWRKDSILDEVSIFYNIDNFINVINYYNNYQRWNIISTKCINLSYSLKWTQNLKPLINLIN